jgi:hypothetical protein
MASTDRVGSAMTSRQTRCTIGAIADRYPFDALHAYVFATDPGVLQLFGKRHDHLEARPVARTVWLAQAEAHRQAMHSRDEDTDELRRHCRLRAIAALLLD